MEKQNETHSADYYGLQYDTPIDHGTTHLSVVDKWGGAASVTSTVSRTRYLAPKDLKEKKRKKKRSDQSVDQSYLGKPRYGS